MARISVAFATCIFSLVIILSLKTNPCLQSHESLGCQKDIELDFPTLIENFSFPAFVQKPMKSRKLMGHIRVRLGLSFLGFFPMPSVFGKKT